MTFNKLSFEEQAIIAMRRKGITLTELANQLDISVAYASDILKGNRKSIEQRKKIAEYLELDEDEIA